MKIGLYIKQEFILLIAHIVTMAMAFIMTLVKRMGNGMDLLPR
jgi:hypothetical protein